MPFQYLLTNLLVDVAGAQGAIFLDSVGEAVELVSRRATPYELKLEGAYQGIFLRRLDKLTEQLGNGAVLSLTLSGRHLKVMDADANARPGSVVEAQALKLVKHPGSGYVAEKFVALCHQLFQATLVHYLVIEAYFFGQDLVEDYSSYAGLFVPPAAVF